MTRLSPFAANKKKDRVTIGKVGAVHGIHGELRIIPLTDFVERFAGMKEVMVGDEMLHIESCKFHKQFVLLKFREYPVREQAMRLTGRLLTVARDEAVPLEEGEFYTFDIIGLTVYDTAGTELGTVENVLRTGSNDVYQARRPDGRELLIPALKAVVREIDIAGGRMVVDLPEETDDDMITLFPEMFAGPFGASITKRAVEKGILDIHFTNFRDYSFDKHRHVDDSPFGGGAGMVLKPEPMYRAVRAVLEETAMHAASRRVLIMDPAGPVFTQAKAKELASYEQLVFICGHYEGFDARIYPLADEAISIGDFVLTGGELPAMVITDAVSRMLPGVLGDAESAPTDSFYDGLLGFPQYTRPRDFEGMEVPEVLLLGDHAKIRQWRHEQSLRLTQEKRPDLLAKKALSDEDRDILRRFEQPG